MAGSGNNEEASDLFGATLFTAEGNTGAFGNIQHVQYEIDGVLTDIVISFGTRGVEFYTMDADTGALTLTSTDYDPLSNDQGHEDGVFLRPTGSCIGSETGIKQTAIRIRQLRKVQLPIS